MPYNPETGKFEYGSHWDGVDTSNRKGSPFKQSKLSHRKWKKKAKKRNARNANTRANNSAYGRNIR